MVNAATDLPFGVIVPVPKKLTIKLLYVGPAVVDKVSEFRFNVVAAGVNELVPKLSLLNQLLVVIVARELSLVIDKLGLLVVEPPDVDPTL